MDLQSILWHMYMQQLCFFDYILHFLHMEMGSKGQPGQLIHEEVLNNARKK